MLSFFLFCHSASPCFYSLIQNFVWACLSVCLSFLLSVSSYILCSVSLYFANFCTSLGDQLRWAFAFLGAGQCALYDDTSCTTTPVPWGKCYPVFVIWLCHGCWCRQADLWRTKQAVLAGPASHVATQGVQWSPLSVSVCSVQHVTTNWGGGAACVII